MNNLNQLILECDELSRTDPLRAFGTLRKALLKMYVALTEKDRELTRVEGTMRDQTQRADDLAKSLEKITKQYSDLAEKAVTDIDKDLSQKLEEVTRQKDNAYWERNCVVSALSKLFPSSIEEHEDAPGQEWDKDWRNVVFIDLPTGQVSWHIHDSEIRNFAHLPKKQGRVWDGHTTHQKYERLLNLINVFALKEQNYLQLIELLVAAVKDNAFRKEKFTEVVVRFEYILHPIECSAKQETR